MTVSEPDLHVEERISSLLDAMTLDEKASLTAGAGLWYLPPVERLGIPALKVSNGPSGVRGDSLIGRRSLSMPCGMMIGSTWNEDLVGRLGAALAGEAASKGVHVLLGPTVCIVRTPLAGRTFESYSEDPLLTARLAVAYVKGVQAQGIACCIKHFACNDQEYERMTISAEVDEQTLRDIHLPAFEAAVKEAGVWAVMTAYNRVNGVYCGEHDFLIGRVLRDEWGFNGLVMSDWFGTHSTIAAATAGLDLEMPGPSAWFDGNLADAVRRGELEESIVDEQVRHLLRLMARVGILDGDPRAGQDEREEDDPGRRAVARQVVTEGTVLLRNERQLLPLDPSVLVAKLVAVIGPNAGVLETGGGSSEVTPHRRRRVYEAMAERLAGVEVVHEVGCRIDRELPTIDMRLVGDELELEYFAKDECAGEVVGRETAHMGRLTWVGPPCAGTVAGECSIRVRGTFTPDVSGTWQLGLESAGRSVWRLDGEVVVDNSSPTRGHGFYGAGSALKDSSCALESGRAYDLEVDVWPRSSSSPVLGVRLAASRPVADDEMAVAVAAAKAADVAVVVVGLNRSWESEGFDRPDLHLPGRQDELVAAVCAANPRTVVIVNAGSPVAMPWLDAAGAVLLPWYPGEEGADALADMLVGLVEPSGRLPVTLPERREDTPAGDDPTHYPGMDGKVMYAEKSLVGYRHYDARSIRPLFPFGFGLGYTTFAYNPTADVEGRTITVELTNAGDRAGTEVVQAYVHTEGTVAVATLAAFVKVWLEAGETAPVVVELPEAAFPHPGHYDVVIGSSSRDVHIRTSVEIAG